MKKSVKIILGIIIVIILLLIIAFGIDYYRCSNLKEPIFRLSMYKPDIAISDGSEYISYYCPGYIVDLQRTPTLDGKMQVKWIAMQIFNKTIINKKSEENNMLANKKAVIIKVNEKYLDVMGFEGASDLYNVSYSSEGNIGFKQGQEILIYFNGTIAESFPAQIGKVGKIEILKEKSDIEIPEDILKFYYNSKEKVNINVSNLGTTGIELTIADTNELPYNYSHSYKIYKKVKNESYTGIGQKIGEDTENSISGYTRSRSTI